MRGLQANEIELIAEYDRMFDADNRNIEDAEESAWYLYDLSQGLHFEPNFNWEDYH